MVNCAWGVLCAALLATTAVAEVSVRSPDEKLVFTLDVDDRGAPRYRVSYRGEEVVRKSRLGLRFARASSLDDGFEIGDTRRSKVDQTWELPWGERKTVRDRHNELAVQLVSGQDPARRLDLRVRVFDDGLGFRYEVPEGDRPERIVSDELTQFAVPRNATAWWIPGRRFNRYEYLYRQTGVDDVVLAHTPMTLRLPSGVHLSLHEAALTDYAAMVLDHRREGVFEANLTPWSDGTKVKTTGSFKTPWRTIHVAPDAIGLINSDLILNLNEPNALGDVSWVEPGKYIGIWWAMHIRTRTWGSGPQHGATTAETRSYIDFAAKYGFSGVLVEGWNVGWDGDWYRNGAVFDFTQPYPDFDLESLADYARERGVRLVGHHETSGDITNYERQMGDAYDLYQRLGVRAVKTGYVADAGELARVDEAGLRRYEWHDGQFAVNHFLRSVIEAAKRQISINTHEPIKDTGLRRTYPNWVTREGARGMEYSAWGDPSNPPEHTTILPFTRLLSGPMDYTPGIFNLTFQGESGKNRVETTLAKQLALYVVIHSPLQMAADLPTHYERRPDAFQFIVDVPADWGDSRALAGQVGEFLVMARKARDGDDWYLGAITDDQARSLDVPLTFLEPGERYTAQVYRDGDDANWRSNPYSLVIEEQSVDSASMLKLPLAAGGGAAVRLVALGSGTD